MYYAMPTPAGRWLNNGKCQVNRISCSQIADRPLNEFGYDESARDAALLACTASQRNGRGLMSKTPASASTHVRR